MIDDVINEHFMYFFAISFIKSHRHTGNDFCSPVIQKQQLPLVLIKCKALDLTLLFHIIECFFRGYFYDVFVKML